MNDLLTTMEKVKDKSNDCKAAYKHFIQPFQSDGTPNKALALLLPLIDGKAKRREEILKESKMFDKINRGVGSHFFTFLKETEILDYNKSRKTWTQGKNYLPFMGFLATKMFQSGDLRYEFANLIVKYEGGNAMDFILKY